MACECWVNVTACSHARRSLPPFDHTLRSLSPFTDCQCPVVTPSAHCHCSLNITQRELSLLSSVTALYVGGVHVEEGLNIHPTATVIAATMKDDHCSGVVARSCNCERLRHQGYAPAPSPSI